MAASVLACCLALGSHTSQAQEMPPPPPPLPVFDAAPVPILPPVDALAPVPRFAEATFDPLPEAKTAVFSGSAASQREIQQTAQIATRARARADEPYDFSVATELPGPDQIFRRVSEAEFFEGIRQGYKGFAGGGRIIFPEEVALTTEPYKKRQFPYVVKGVEPNYVLHGRLYFEQPNFERQGWDLGVLSPFINMGVYYYDLATLPYHYMTRPFERYDTSAGKCLPGDSTPLLLYPEELSVTGLVGEAAVVTGLFYLFP